MKIIILLISFAFIATLGIAALAESETITDTTGDVMHWRYTETAWGWQTNVVNKPNIDLIELSYIVSGDQVTLSLKVAGTITNSDLISYWAYLNTSDSNYMLYWLGGEGSGWAMSTDEESFQMDSDPDITVSGDTITATYNVVGTFTTGVNLWGWAVEYTVYGDVTNEWWADWIPNGESPYYDQYNGNDDLVDDPIDDDPIEDPADEPADELDDSGEEGTPGFEILLLIIAFVVVFFIIKKKK